MSSRPVIVAHRAGNHPDTALRALGRAEAIELDVHVFRGRVVLRHAKVLRPTSRLWERWYLLPRSTEVATIEQVLAVVPPRIPLLLDLKCFTTRAARRIRRTVEDDRPLVVSSRSWWILRAFRDRPRTSMLRSCGKQSQLRLAGIFPGLGPTTGIVAHERLLDPEAIQRILTATPLLYTWAVRSTERGRVLGRAGVSGLIVDDLDQEWLSLDEDDQPIGG